MRSELAYNYSFPKTSEIKVELTKEYLNPRTFEKLLESVRTNFILLSFRFFFCLGYLKVSKRALILKKFTRWYKETKLLKK